MTIELIWRSHTLFAHRLDDEWIILRTIHRMPTNAIQVYKQLSTTTRYFVYFLRRRCINDIYLMDEKKKKDDENCFDQLTA